MPPLSERLGLRRERESSGTDPALRARAGFYLFAIGGAIGLISLTLPAQTGRDGVAILAAALAALVLGVVELVGYERLPQAAFQAFTACGTALVSAAVFFGGLDGALYGLFYFWVVLYAAYFFDVRSTAAHVAGVGGGYGLVLALDEHARGPLAWFLTMSTLAVVAALVLILRGRLERTLTSEREQVERLRQLDRLKDDFIATVSHELRTPVAAVYGASETLKRSDLSGDRRGELLVVIGREARRLAQLVSDVLVSDGLERGAFRLRLGSCDVSALAAEVAEAARLASRPSRRVVFEAAPGVPVAQADAERLRQVLGNVVDNALKYSPSEAMVTIDVGTDGDGIRVCVRDEGIGIPAGERERIFEKFHRLDPHLTGGVTGSGLGLYIARRLVEGMGGRIWAEAGSTGSVFTIALLAATPSPPDGARDEHATSVASGL